MIAIGVDAGGTATTAVAARGGDVFGRAVGPAANVASAGAQAAGAAIVATMRDALGEARPDAVHIGAAGGARPAAAAALAAIVTAAFPAAAVRVGHDAAIALRAAIPSGPGIVLVAGTGSIAYAEAGPHAVLVGGHGSVLGDEGSAYALGIAAVRRYARVLDGRAPADETTALVARELGAADRAALHAAIYEDRPPPARIAALAPAIVAFAGKGSRTAIHLVQEAAKELGDLVKAAARGAELTDAAPPIALAGGLLRENSLLTYLLETRLTGDFTGSPLVRGGFEPVLGALALAQAAAVGSGRSS